MRRTNAAGSKSVTDIDAILAESRRHLSLDTSQPWTLISSRTKLGKKLFEVKQDGRLLVGKISDSRKAQSAYGFLSTLWEAGMRPPSPYTVVEPIAYVEPMHLLLQEKAPGTQLAALIDSTEAADGVRRAAKWLAMLHSLQLDPSPRRIADNDIARCEEELIAELPAQQDRIRTLVKHITSCAPPSDTVPTHGDYHPMNVFLSPDGRVTVIDIDTFGARPREADVAYFIAQLQIQSSSPTVPELQREFLREYLTSSGASLNNAWINAQAAKAFVRSLHYDLCILRTRDTKIVEPMLQRAEKSIHSGRNV